LIYKHNRLIRLLGLQRLQKIISLFRIPSASGGRCSFSDSQFEGGTQHVPNGYSHILCSLFTICRIIPNSAGSVAAFVVSVATVVEFLSNETDVASPSQQIEMFSSKLINQWRKFIDD
jgi:hypothetical protein